MRNERGSKTNLEETKKKKKKRVINMGAYQLPTQLRKSRLGVKSYANPGAIVTNRADRLPNSIKRSL